MEKTNPNKANLSQNKANSNPIAERTKLMHSVYIQRIKNKNADRSYEKTKPIQTQFQKPGNEPKKRKKKRVSGTVLRLWVAGKIDFLDGCDILLGKIYGKSQFNLFWRLIL
ncbi:MAG: hypothetical protein HQ580_04535 [Planctomycetes bacterium]|nr:hypothetical protein [Planctomycetota bacterium]